MMSRNYGLSLYDWDSDGMEDNPRWGAWAKYEDVRDLIEEMIDTHRTEQEALRSQIASLESQLEEALADTEAFTSEIASLESQLEEALADTANLQALLDDYRNRSYEG